MTGFTPLPPTCPYTNWPMIDSPDCEMCPCGHRHIKIQAYVMGTKPLDDRALACTAHPDDCPNGPLPHEYAPDLGPVSDDVMWCCRQPWEPT